MTMDAREPAPVLTVVVAAVARFKNPAFSMISELG